MFGSFVLHLDWFKDSVHVHVSGFSYAWEPSVILLREDECVRSNGHGHGHGYGYGHGHGHGHGHSHELLISAKRLRTNPKISTLFLLGGERVRVGISLF